MNRQHDLGWWSDWIRQDIDEVHNCTPNPHSTVGVLLHKAAGREAPSWYLAFTREATEAEVAQGLAPEVGDILDAMELAINHCPFCGIELLQVADA